MKTALIRLINTPANKIKNKERNRNKILLMKLFFTMSKIVKSKYKKLI